MALGFTGFFILVMIGCAITLGVSIAENWQRIFAAIDGASDSGASQAARSFTTTHCNPYELPDVAQRMVLHELDEEIGEAQEPALWAFERPARRNNQIAFRFA
jgi:hypothetical protein